MGKTNPSFITLALLFITIYASGKTWPALNSGIMPTSAVNPSTNVPITLPTAAVPSQSLDLEPLELPLNGEVHYYKTAATIAPFSISTEPGLNYYAKLVDKKTGQTAVTIFARGSHNYYVRSKLKGKVTVPHPKKSIPIGTLKSISRQTGVIFK